MNGTDERKTVWETLYDFLTEIFAILIPGAYFVSFFVFLILIYFSCISGDAAAGGSFLSGNVSSIFGLLAAAVTYCFGAFFHRREIKVVDEASARHIYEKNQHESGHAFAFANALSENYIRRIAFILRYHLYRCSKAGEKDSKDAGKTGEQTIRALEEALNAAIARAIADTAALLETEQLENERVRKLALQFKEAGKRKSAKEMQSFLEKTGGESELSAASLVETLRRKLLLEESVKTISRTDSRVYKEYLRLINRECHGTLKERIETAVWKTLGPVLAETGRGSGPDRKQDPERKPDVETKVPFYEQVRGIPALLCRPEELIYDGTAFPAITGRNEKLSAFLKALEELENPSEKKKEKQPVSPEAELSGEEKVLRQVLRKVRLLVEDDLKGRVEWPYTKMYQYCFDRGLKFAGLVDWGDGAAARDDFVYVTDTLGLTTDDRVSDEYKRSKIRVNTDKIEISIARPSLGRILEKNEAHIRFNNSMWYAADLLRIPLVISLVLFAGCLGCSILLPEPAYFPDNRFLWIYLLMLTVVYIAAGRYIHNSVLEIMHYQRVRELTVFLEAKSLYESQKKEEEACMTGKNGVGQNGVGQNGGLIRKNDVLKNTGLKEPGEKDENGKK